VELKNYIIKNKFTNIYEGSSENVLSRYYGAAKKFSSDIIIRVTSDCPLIDSEVIDKTLELYKTGKFDYVNNFSKKRFPYGSEVEVCITVEFGIYTRFPSFMII
jgi:spore coat polysaccharide biosynthesis protein SpsF